MGSFFSDSKSLIIEMSEMEAELQPTSIPSDTKVSVIGFSNNELANSFGKNLADALVEIGRIIDLTTLDGVTIGYDYDEALASIDQGFENAPPLSRTDTEALQGVAKAVDVVRGAEIKTHLIFGASALVRMVQSDPSEEDLASCVEIIAHECAHVQINAHKVAHISEFRPGRIISDYKTAVLAQVAGILWDEYAACRLVSENFKYSSAHHSSGLITSLKDVRERANSGIRAYRSHGNLKRLLEDAGSELCLPIKMVAYLLGDMDGRRLSWAEFEPARLAAIEAGYEKIFDDLHVKLRSLWDNRQSWESSLEVMRPLMNIANAVLEVGGIYLEQQPDNTCYIRVPFTADTM